MKNCVLLTVLLTAFMGLKTNAYLHCFQCGGLQASATKCAFYNPNVNTCTSGSDLGFQGLTPFCYVSIIFKIFIYFSNKYDYRLRQMPVL